VGLTLVWGDRADGRDLFTAGHMAGESTHFADDALAREAHHQGRAVVALGRGAERAHQELVGLGLEVRGQLPAHGHCHGGAHGAQHLLGTHTHIQLQAQRRTRILKQVQNKTGKHGNSSTLKENRKQTDDSQHL